MNCSSEGLIQNANDAFNFIYGGHTTFTLVSKKTSKRFTYKTKSGQSNGGRKPFIFVRVLTGSDNESDYTYLGYIHPDKIGLQAGAKGTPGAPSYRGLDWAINKFAGNEMPDDIEIWHSGRCGACNRKLTVPESIATGLGPICAGRV